MARLRRMLTDVQLICIIAAGLALIVSSCCAHEHDILVQMYHREQIQCLATHESYDDAQRCVDGVRERYGPALDALELADE